MKTILKNIAVLLFFLLTTPATAQYSSDNGWFTVDEVSGCEGLTVNITIDASAPCNCGTSGCPCDFDYEGDGTYDPKSNPFTFTFDDPGNYRLEILFPNPFGSDYIDIKIANNIAPDFNIHSCSGETIVIDITDNNFDNYIIDYDDGVVETITKGSPAPQHNYANNTARTVRVRGLNNNAADNCAVANNTVTPLATLPAPAITSLAMLDNSSLELNYDLQPDIKYDLEILPPNATKYSYVKGISESTLKDTIRNLSLSDNYYCFRIAVRDPCNNTVAAYSNSVCSIDLNLSTQDNVNVLTWQTTDPDINFSLVRDDLLTQPVSASARSYNDTNIECNIDYCYTLVANYTNGHTSTSLTQCGTSFSTTPPAEVRNISTIVNGTAINIVWEAPANNIAEYRIKRDVNAIATVTNATEYLDEGLAPQEKSYCYNINTTDECGNNNNQSITACSIRLTGTIDSNNNIQLSWNSYEGWTNGAAQYIIEKSYSSGGTSQITTNDTSFEEVENNNNQQVIQYRIIARPVNNTLTGSVSNVITIIKPVNVYYPNAFTPDGNGTNEEFRVHGKFIASYELQVYNRWGELIFFSDNMDKGWNGTYNGSMLPEGTYAFIARMHDMAGREIEKSGTILLLRR
ncbi:hypothetical protein C900_04378 [Fulvivirga imtechensis AK7]|uniref:Fibronectin type-III domain-containing protein n=1 Tax=Fulvivirga imtechensis AK7 TaxID=1237149 RepID=L8JP74_9BACT|nr:T9SS C-terminal target domain-containing protein [Fulvivirga imtechensis]ELR70008.1 hypothetical protein C900_04378 [Fulvivirga imtechensis AK7]